MTESILLKNGQAFLFSPHNTFSRQDLNQGKGMRLESASILIEDGVIKEISQHIPDSRAQKIIDCKGLWISPGLIDSQVHFREPGFTHKEDIESGSTAAAMGGFTSFFEMPNTKPPTTELNLLKQKLDKASLVSPINYAFFGGASDSNMDSLPAMETEIGCSGIKVFMGSSTGNMLVDSMETLEKILKKLQRRLVVHSEDETRIKDRKPLTEAPGATAHLHPVWRDVTTALTSTQKITELARRLNKKIHVLHVSSADEMAWLKNYQDIATVELLPQHLLFSAPSCYDQFGTLCQQNPPIRDESHRLGLLKGLKEGFVDVLASDHAPHTMEEKSKPYPQSPSGMPGTQTLFLMLSTLVEKGEIGMPQLIHLLTEGPRRVFGIYNRGRIAPGFFCRPHYYRSKKITKN
jgi:dihydroorotase